MIEALNQITQIVVLIFLLSSMSSIGLGLSFQEIIAPLRRMPLALGALIANFLISPLLAVGISRLFRLDEPFAIGLLVISMAAGAPFMPKIVIVAKGDVASAVGVMVLLMVGTTVCLPLALPLLIKGVEVNPWKIARFLILLMLLPLGVGVLMKARAAAMSARIRPTLEKVSSVALSVMMVLIVALNFRGVLQLFGTGAIAAGLLFSALAAAAGWFIGGRGAGHGSVLALGTGLRNIPAALIVAVQNFKDPNVSVMVIVTTIAGILLLVPIARSLGKRGSSSPSSRETLSHQNP